MIFAPFFKDFRVETYTVQCVKQLSLYSMKRNLVSKIFLNDPREPLDTLLSCLLSIIIGIKLKIKIHFQMHLRPNHCLHH